MAPEELFAVAAPEIVLQREDFPGVPLRELVAIVAAPPAGDGFKVTVAPRDHALAWLASFAIAMPDVQRSIDALASFFEREPASMPLLLDTGGSWTTAALDFEEGRAPRMVH